MATAHRVSVLRIRRHISFLLVPSFRNSSYRMSRRCTSYECGLPPADFWANVRSVTMAGEPAWASEPRAATMPGHLFITGPRAPAATQHHQHRPLTPRGSQPGGPAWAPAPPECHSAASVRVPRGSEGRSGNHPGTRQGQQLRLFPCYRDINAGERQTERETDGRTDGRSSKEGLSRQ